MEDLNSHDCIESIIPWAMHAAKAHPATMERIKASVLDPEQQQAAFASYELRIMELRLAAAKLYNFSLDVQRATERQRDDLEAEKAVLELTKEALNR